MLRTVVTESPGEQPAPSECSWRVSVGTAGVLGLRAVPMDVAPTTAYMMLGGRCTRDCAFCTQARRSQAGAEALSRVTWPEFGAQEVRERVARAFELGAIGRACFQVTVTPSALGEAGEAVAQLAEHSRVPICVSAAAQDQEQVAKLLAAGAERVTLALDAASERVYRQTKSGSWERALDLLQGCALRFPGRIGTHLIVGLGEAECEMMERIQWLLDLGVTVGLFAFTPVRGTALADRPPPAVEYYRRVQAALWLMLRGLTRADHFRYDGACGRAVYLGMGAQALRRELAGGEAFRTAGCAHCNRPYYNERPGGVIYNYPRPLTSDEAEREITQLVESLQDAGNADALSGDQGRLRNDTETAESLATNELTQEATSSTRR